MSVPPDRAAHAREWFSFATGDLEVAGRLLEAGDEIDLRYGCWHFQQAVEKAIKTALVLEDIEFPWSHDLVELFELLPAEWALRVGGGGLDLVQVSSWATLSRYPGATPIDESPEDVRRIFSEASEFATAVGQELDSRLAVFSSPPSP